MLQSNSGITAVQRGNDATESCVGVDSFVLLSGELSQIYLILPLCAAVLWTITTGATTLLVVTRHCVLVIFTNRWRQS